MIFYNKKLSKNSSQQSESKYKRIIENINDLVVIINFGLDIEYINERIAYKLLKYRKEEIIGTSCLEFIHPDDIDKVVEIIKEGFKHSETVVKLRFKHRDGYWLWFECGGYTFRDEENKLKWLIVCRDLTERKLVEQRYQNLFDKSPNAILIINFDGKIIDANSTTKKLFGYDSNYFVGKSINDLDSIFNFDVKQYFKKIFHATFKENFPDPIEVIVKKSEANLIWVEIQASIIKQNNKILIQLIFQDVTEKKNAELLEEKFKEKLEEKVQSRTNELNEALQQQTLFLDQIAKSSQFKTEFMSTMSHELRTPLNAIIGFTELLLEGVYGPLNNDQMEFISDIKVSADYQYEMIKHILDISKIEAGQVTLNIQKFSLNNMIKQIKSSLRSLYKKKNLKFKIKGLDSEKEICADPIRFKEIILNLVSNAVKFTIEGTITLTVQEKYDYWLFKVADTGIGIAQQDFHLVFKEFKRIDSTYVRSVPGTGLGLSLTKRLVILHGGDVTFSSVLGVGTTFTFTIPKIK
ncbi:MAG: PAS domain-containing sensor histidine kinase [Candidatus Lokiarchaeia archaeon]